MGDKIKGRIGKYFGGKIRVRVCGVLIEENRILLAEHSGIGPKGKLLIPPGGGLEFGETVENALVREFREETGLSVEVHKLLFVNEYINHPLHAVELFFKVTRIAGNLEVGIDPELDDSEQLLQQTRFYSGRDLKKMDPDVLHSLLRQEPDPIKFEHLSGFFNFVVNS